MALPHLLGLFAPAPAPAPAVEVGAEGVAAAATLLRGSSGGAAPNKRSRAGDARLAAGDGLPAPLRTGCCEALAPELGLAIPGDAFTAPLPVILAPLLLRGSDMTALAPLPPLGAITALFLGAASANAASACATELGKWLAAGATLTSLRRDTGAAAGEIALPHLLGPFTAPPPPEAEAGAVATGAADLGVCFAEGVPLATCGVLFAEGMPLADAGVVAPRPKLPRVPVAACLGVAFALLGVARLFTLFACATFETAGVGGLAAAEAGNKPRAAPAPLGDCTLGEAALLASHCSAAARSNSRADSDSCNYHISYARVEL